MVDVAIQDQRLDPTAAMCAAATQNVCVVHDDRSVSGARRSEGVRVGSIECRH